MSFKTARKHKNKIIKNKLDFEFKVNFLVERCRIRYKYKAVDIRTRYIKSPLEFWQYYTICKLNDGCYFEVDNDNLKIFLNGISNKKITSSNNNIKTSSNNNIKTSSNNNIKTSSNNKITSFNDIMKISIKRILKDAQYILKAWTNEATDIVYKQNFLLKYDKSLVKFKVIKYLKLT